MELSPKSGWWGEELSRKSSPVVHFNKSKTFWKKVHPWFLGWLKVSIDGVSVYTGLCVGRIDSLNKKDQTIKIKNFITSEW
jgi:hypothetical protein